MISRIWHGWTTLENADRYEHLLKTEVFPGIFAKNVAGFERIELFRRNIRDEVEFITVMWFDSLEAVKAFAGDDYETAYVPDAARRVLKRFDAQSQHFEIREQHHMS
jgi:heme-degrading monooxygenase HmoA